MRDQSRLHDALWDWIKDRNGGEFTMADAAAALIGFDSIKVQLQLHSFLDEKKIIVSSRSARFGHRYREPACSGRFAPRRSWHRADPLPLFEAWARIARLPFLGARGEHRHTGTVVGTDPEDG